MHTVNEGYTDMNTGGRVNFEKGLRVRVLTLEGKISETVYTVEQERSDRKGHILLQEEGKNRATKIHHRRIIPMAAEGSACVIVADKPTGICPTCGQDKEMSASDTTMYCESCDKHYQLYWIGAKPMADDTATTTTKEATASTEPQTTKAERTAKEPEKVDLCELAKTEGCELWNKTVKFDHARISATSHVLILTKSDPARKLCFNLYNGTLGRRGKPLPLENFLADKELEGVKKPRPWFDVSDLDAQRKKLEADGYELHGTSTKAANDDTPENAGEPVE